MKLSEFIKQLQKIFVECGDLDIHFWYGPGELWCNYYDKSYRIDPWDELEIILDD